MTRDTNEDKPGTTGAKNEKALRILAALDELDAELAAAEHERLLELGRERMKRLPREFLDEMAAFIKSEFLDPTDEELDLAAEKEMGINAERGVEISAAKAPAILASSAQASPADRPAGAVIRFADFADDALRKLIAYLDSRFATPFQPARAGARFMASHGPRGAAPVPEAARDPDMVAAAQDLLTRLPDWTVVPVSGRTGVEAASVFAILWKGEGTAPDLPADRVRVKVDGAPLDPDEGYIADHTQIFALPPGRVFIAFETLRPAGVIVTSDPDGTLLLDFQSS